MDKQSLRLRDESYILNLGNVMLLACTSGSEQWKISSLLSKNSEATTIPKSTLFSLLFNLTSKKQRPMIGSLKFWKLYMSKGRIMYMLGVY